MKRKSILLWILILILMLLTTLSCRLTGAGGPPSNALILRVAASPNLQTWLDAAIADFNREKFESTTGKPLYVEATYLEAGAFAADLTHFTVYDLWIPEQVVWVDLVSESGYEAFGTDCVNLVHSPLVIAMWQPLAEALGWPGDDLGWLDLGSLAADPSAWAYYSGGQFGETFRLGHAHPGLTASGTATLLSVVQAAESQTEAVGADEIAEPIVQASVTAFESSVATFTSTANELTALMVERGPLYLNAAVTYENLVTEVAQEEASIIPIYPFEGTYMADFPGCINQEMGDDKTAGASAFRDFLLSPDAQVMAWEAGLRPLDAASIEETASQPLIDLDQPAVLFEQPSASSVMAVQELWKSARKAVNLVMVLDTSGSMDGDKLENVKAAAVDLINTMGQSDYVSILVYNLKSEVELLVDHARIGDSRDEVIRLVQGLTAWSGTPLYDSIAMAADQVAQTQSASTSNVIIVLTDGNDTESFNHRFNQSLVDQAKANNTTVYTIAYGRDADEDVLEELALQANGHFYLADEANIAEIYAEMSVMVGGSLGIGR